MSLNEAASSLGVSTDALISRIERGDLPEAKLIDDEWQIAPVDLPIVADREGWVIDLTDGSTPNVELDDLLERLLTLNDDLTVSETSRIIAEEKVAAQEIELEAAHRKVRDLESMIEEQHSENGRLAVDLRNAQADVRIAQAIADDRKEQIAELRAISENERQRANDDIAVHRRQTTEMRHQLENSLTTMGWWSRRRYAKTTQRR